MKRLSAYSLLFIICFYAGGYLAMFKIQQWNIYSEMDNSQKNIETLIIPKSYFKTHLERKGKEINWQGKIYDIKAVKFKGANAIVRAICDKKENKLISGLADYLKEKDEQGHNATKEFDKLLKLEFLSTKFFHFNFKFSLKEFNNSRVFQTLEGFSGLNSPPPRCI